MGWLLQAAADAGRPDPRTVTGKPEILGGSRFRHAATGVGVAHVAHLALQGMGRSLDGTRVAVEGFGAVGRWAIIDLPEQGATIVAVSDKSGAVHNEKGVDVAALPPSDEWWLASTPPATSATTVAEPIRPSPRLARRESISW